MNQTRVYFDATTLFNNPINDGIRRASREIFNALSSKLFVGHGFSVVPIMFDGFVAKVNYSPFFNAEYGFASSPIDGQEINFGENDVLFIPAYDIFVPEKHFNFQHLASNIRIISVIYDLLPITNKEWFPPDTGVRFKSSLDSQIFYSDHIIVNSKKVYNDLVEYIKLEKFVVDDSTISVLPLLGLQSNDQSIKQRAEGQKGKQAQRFLGDFRLLTVGTIEPRKGHFDILNAFFDTVESTTNFSLTFVGRLGWGVEKELDLIDKALKEYPDRFSWIQGATDSELETLYRSSDLCIASSHDEGFGLPVIESLQRGLPVLARGIEVFREVSDGQIVTFGHSMDYPDIQSAFRSISKVVSVGHERLELFKPKTSLDFRLNLLGILNIVCNFSYEN